MTSAPPSTATMSTASKESNPSLASLSSRTSLKRSRILFDTPSSSSYHTFVPTVDPTIHRNVIQRRIRTLYPVIPPDNGGGKEEKDLSGSGCQLTSKILKEMKEESLNKLRSGGGGGTAAGSVDKAKEGQLIVHREVDLMANSGGAVDAAAGGGIVGGGVVALAGQRIGTSSAAATTTTAAKPAATEGGVVALKEEDKKHEGGILVKKSTSTKIPTPKWHAPYHLTTVLSSHLGWVRSLAFDPTNDMFATGGADRTIKIFDLAKACVGASDALKITLTGHVSPIRGLAFSERHPYLFSAGEDKMVKCWDLETNQVIRHYHGHLSGVFALALHPTLDLLVTGGRDAVARVWDMRSKNQVHCLSGHDNTVGAILTKSTDPQIITGSYDSTIKLWDLVAGKCMTTLTHHKKAVRALVQPTFENTFLSGAADTLKKWQGRDGRFIKNFTGHKSVINALALNDDGVLLSAADDGTMNFWDYHSGYCFQQTTTIAQPGSLDAENGIFAAGFDLTGSRLITCEADKTIKIWKQEEEASEISHPIDMSGWRKKCLKEAKQRY